MLLSQTYFQRKLLPVPDVFHRRLIHLLMRRSNRNFNIPPPPRCEPRAFDHFLCPASGEFDLQGLPGGGDYGHQWQLKRTKKQENLAIILSSPCETSSNGIHLRTRRVIRELIGHMMVEIYDHRCQLAKKKERRKPCNNSVFTM